MNRDEYVQKLKSQIDQWNAQAAKWEAGSAKQLEEFRQRRDAAMTELKRLQSASADAWQDMMRGADAALKGMQDAFEKARSQFGRK
jgi:flagellar hook-basal body complex protein FliE